MSGYLFGIMKGYTGRVEDRQASGPWQHPSGCGRPAGQLWYCNMHGRKWSHEAKNGQACCQKGRLDGRTGSDLSQRLWQVGWTGKMTMEGYLGIS